MLKNHVHINLFFFFSLKFLAASITNTVRNEDLIRHVEYKEFVEPILILLNQYQQKRKVRQGVIIFLHNQFPSGLTIFQVKLLKHIGPTSASIMTKVIFYSELKQRVHVCK